MAYTRKAILDGRKVVDDYRLAHSQLYISDAYRPTLSQEHFPLIEKMQVELRKLGFNSYDELHEASNNLLVKDMGFKDTADFDLKATEAQIEEICRMWH